MVAFVNDAMKNYLIIGASSGIGKALAAQLVSEGNKVWGTYHTTNDDLAEGVEYFPLDVEKPFDLSLFTTIPEVLDGLVYCPGTINLKPFKRIHPEDFAADLDLQVLGAIRTIQAALPTLKKSTQASIVMFSTVAVQTGFTFHTQVAVSKGAIEGLTRSLAAELAPSVRVNAIAPSLTDTPLASEMLSTDQKKESHALRHPLKRVGAAEDLAQAAAFLLSEKSSWITGQILPVDGGMSTIK